MGVMPKYSCQRKKIFLQFFFATIMKLRCVQRVLLKILVYSYWNSGNKLFSQKMKKMQFIGRKIDENINLDITNQKPMLSTPKFSLV
jgi:hypothetical protein